MHDRNGWDEELPRNYTNQKKKQQQTNEEEEELQLFWLMIRFGCDMNAWFDLIIYFSFIFLYYFILISWREIHHIKNDDKICILLCYLKKLNFPHRKSQNGQETALKKENGVDWQSKPVVFRTWANSILSFHFLFIQLMLIMIIFKIVPWHTVHLD